VTLPRPSFHRSTALIYVRQSRHKEGERTVSPEVQEQQCRGLPAVAACDQVEVFSDLDVSGGKLKGRKAFLALIDRVKGAEVSVVAAYDQSRGFRNTSDALDFYALMEKRPEIEVVFVHGRFDRSPAGEFTYTTLAAAHAMERRMTGEKIRDAYRYATQRGEMVGQVPGGYIRNPDGSISIDEDVAPTIRRIFEMYATGRFTARDLARRFNAEGVPKLPRSRGADWHWHSIAEILRNVAYAGVAFSESRRRGGHGRPIPASWPALISEGCLVLSKPSHNDASGVVDGEHPARKSSRMHSKACSDAHVASAYTAQGKPTGTRASTMPAGTEGRSWSPALSAGCGKTKSLRGLARCWSSSRGCSRPTSRAVSTR